MAIESKPRCFVAMAFDHDDTDALYETAILPVLKANGVIPVIINRREDNRDINHQIIEQLEACDFCITDLTYTRPSVYFEAGYAQRAAEVIYTVRSDHLGKNQPDDLRVHFDLQMKPLIKWASQTDATFASRLERRLKSTVLRQWRAKQERNAKEQAERAAFSQMAVNKRLLELRKQALTAISKLGYTAWTPLVGHEQKYAPLSLRNALQQMQTLNWVMSEQRSKRRLAVVSFRVEEALTLKPLRDEFGYRFVSSWYPPHLVGYKMVEERSPINKTVEHHLLCSLSSVPQSRIMSAMPSLYWDEANMRYSLQTEWTYEGSLWKAKGKKRDRVEVELSVSRLIYLHLLDAIQSLPEFKRRVQQVVDQIEGNQ